MININLLPKFQAIAVKWLIFALISAVVIILLHARCKIILVERQEKIALLKKEIHTIDAEIANVPKKNLTLIRNNKPLLTFFTLLKKLPDTMPVGVYLTELSMIKNNLKLTGYAEKTALISGWVGVLNAAHFSVSLQEIVRNKEADDFPIKFCLQVNFQ